MFKGNLGCVKGENMYFLKFILQLTFRHRLIKSCYFQRLVVSLSVPVIKSKIKKSAFEG